MTLVRRFEAEKLDWLVPAWEAPRNVHAFATTRNAGDAEGWFDLGPAHLAAFDPAARAAVVANRTRVAEFLPSRPVWLEQVHGALVATIDASNVASLRELAPIADAAVTRLADVPLGVRVADCLPVLFADHDGSVVAVAHAGWRGLARGVLEATVAAMEVDAESLVAWLGPAIGPRAFEVGDDVRNAFCETDASAAAHFIAIGPAKWLMDLPVLARKRLERLGVASIGAANACTFSEPTRFFSYRRDRGSARMASFVWRSQRG